MKNPMLDILNSPQQASAQMSAPNNPMQMVAQFKAFMQTMTPQGAKAKVEQLLQSGQMTPQQFEQLKQQAMGLRSILKM